MTIIRTISIALIMAFALSLAPQSKAAAADGDLNIMIFDTARVFTETKAGKSLIEQVQKMGKDLQEELQKEQDKLQGEAEKLNEQRDLIAADVFRERGEKLQVEALQFRQEATAKQSALQKGVAEARDKLAKVAEAGLTKVATDHKASMVLRRENLLFFAKPSADLTKEVVDYVNKELPRVKVTPVNEN